MGVGVAYRGRNIYATQVFAQPLVKIKNTLKTSVRSGKPIILNFDFLADFPKSELFIYLNVPDNKARFYTPSGSYYTGGGPLIPKWLTGKTAQISIPTNKGLGKYSLGIGRNGSFFPGIYKFTVLASQKPE